MRINTGRKKGTPGKQGKAPVPHHTELPAIFDACNGMSHEKRNKAIIATFFYLGLRPKECALLTLDDIYDFQRDQFRQTLLLKKAYTKRSKPRTLSLTNQTLLGIWKDYLQVRRDARFRPDQPFFLTQRGGFFSANSIGNLMNKILEHRYGLSRGCTYSGRRYFASRASEKGVPPKVIQVLMGHSSFTTTAGYIFATESQKAEAMALID